MEAIGGTLRALHMKDDTFGRRSRVGGPNVLERIAREGVPAEVGAEGDFASKLVYKNHRSTAKYRGEALAKAETDVARQGYYVPSNASEGYCGATDILSWGRGRKGEIASGTGQLKAVGTWERFVTLKTEG